MDSRDTCVIRINNSNSKSKWDGKAALDALDALFDGIIDEMWYFWFLSIVIIYFEISINIIVVVICN